MMSYILELQDVSKSFKDFSLEDISFTLKPGYIMGLIGSNGAGKSTTIKLILNLMKKDKGSIKVFGLDHIQNERDIKQRIGFVLDQNYYYEDLTILEMKNIIAPTYKKWVDTTFNKYLKEFNLPPKKKIKDLSKGMQMKYSLAIALSHDADLLIMDEPTSGLDPIVRSELLDILSYVIQDESKAILFSTHITSDLDKIADFITFINDGKLIFSMSKEDIHDNYAVIKGKTEFIEKLESRNVKEHIIGLRENKYGFEALTDNKNSIESIFGNNLVMEKPTLEDIMVFYKKGVLK